MLNQLLSSWDRSSIIPNGHLGNQTSVTKDGTGKATDALLEIPPVGRNGGAPLEIFSAQLNK